MFDVGIVIEIAIAIVMEPVRVAHDLIVHFLTLRVARQSRIQELRRAERDETNLAPLTFVHHRPCQTNWRSRARMAFGRRPILVNVMSERIESMADMIAAEVVAVAGQKRMLSKG